MGRPKTIIVSSINITVSPHPEGTYERLIEAISGIEVYAYGDERARIQTARKKTTKKGISVIYGNIFVYTELSRGGDWFDVIAQKPITEDDLPNISIPDNLRPNPKASRFVFDIHKHMFYFERKNDRGEKFTPSRIKKILENLTRDTIIFSHDYEVSLTVTPKHDAINKVLSVPNLRKIIIRLERPNPDDIETEKARLMNKLERMSASRQETILTKAKDAQNLTLDSDTMSLAEVGAVSGFVQVIGKTMNGLKIVKKTSDYPDERTLEVQDGTDPFSVIFDFIRHDSYD